MRIPLATLILASACAAFGSTISASAQSATMPEAEPYVLPRLTGPILMDGNVDEPAWENVEPFPLVMYQPTYQGEITEPTEIRVAYNDTHIYVSGRLYHNDPKNLRANSFYRDRWSGDETFAVVLDTFNDNENANWFYVMPLCTRVDQAVSDDAALGRASSNTDWNTFWDTACSITDEGWFAEIRIPFTSLGFQEENGRVEMGLIVYRWMAHNNHRYVFPDIPPNWERGANKPSVARDIVLQDIDRRNPLYVAPYLLGGGTRLAMLDEANLTAHETDLTREIGLDLKYNITSNLTLDATVNTDFAQVEADDQQVNLTRFSLFFPEKRRFFQERSGMFEFGTGADASRLFHSRRIGLVDGEPVRIYGGARLVGRVGSWDVGLVNMQTADGHGTPAENFGVARLRRRVLNPLSTVGAIATSRIDVDGRYSFAYGIDGVINVAGDEFLTVKLAQTVDREQSGVDPVDASRFMFAWERRNIQGLSYSAELTRSGPDYDPEVGFVRRRDFTYTNLNVDYQAFLGSESPLRRVWVGNWGETYFRNADSSVESVWLHPFAYFETKNGATVLVSTAHSFEDVLEDFALSDDTIVPTDEYWFHDLWLESGPPDSWPFRPSAVFRTGTFYDGWRTLVGIDARWNLSKHLELGPEYEVNILRFGDRDQQLTTHLGRLRIQAALNTHFSSTFFVQYNSTVDAVFVNARLRYNFSEGHDLWLVYDEGLNTLRKRDGFRLPASNRRALLVKYTRTFIW